MVRTRTLFAWEDESHTRHARTGVSLHSHTAHSLETLAIVSTYKERGARLGRLLDELKRQCLRSAGESIDFSRLFFTPPLPPVDSFEAERAQIEDELGLAALVSLTDHDNFEGCEIVRQARPGVDVPYSIEWTVPFGPTYLHLGVHNVPAAEVRDVAREIGRFSSGCSVCNGEGVPCFGAHRKLAQGAVWGGCGLGARARPAADLLARLTSSPAVLVVVNHPVWDMNGIGAREHAAVVGRFLSLYGEFVHALEVNGLRPWSENVSAARLAESFGIPVVAGGDRHGCEPAAVINLTRASTVSEFVEEVRHGGHSDVLYLSHYREPLGLRKIRAACDVLRDNPNHSYGMRRWSDRVFFRDGAGRLRPLSELWPEGDPVSVRASRRAVQSLERWPLRSAVRFALARGADTAA